MAIPIIIDVHIIMFLQLVIEGTNGDLEAQQSSDDQNTNTPAMSNMSSYSSNARDFSMSITKEQELFEICDQNVDNHMICGLDAHHNSSKDDLLEDNSVASNLSLPTGESAQKSFNHGNEDNNTDLEALSTTNTQMQCEEACNPQRASSPDANIAVESLPSNHKRY